jgi:hypothetical protein
MKNLSVQIPFSEAKLKALNSALLKKDLLLEDELETFLLNLYKRSVSKPVQEYLDDIAAEEAKQPAPRPAKPKAGGGT